MAGRIIFREEQRFARGWVSMLGFAVLVAGVAPLAIAVLAAAGVIRTGDEAMAPVGIFAGGMGLLVGGVTFLVMHRARLVTEVREGAGLFVRYIPFHGELQRIPVETAASVRAVTYRPIREYGGWGIRYQLFSRGKAYNVRGDRGVRIDFRDGSHLLIGSQRPEELAAAIGRLA